MVIVAKGISVGESEVLVHREGSWLAVARSCVCRLWWSGASQFNKIKTITETSRIEYHGVCWAMGLGLFIQRQGYIALQFNKCTVFFDRMNYCTVCCVTYVQPCRLLVSPAGLALLARRQIMVINVDFRKKKESSNTITDDVSDYDLYTETIDHFILCSWMISVRCPIRLESLVSWCAWPSVF